MTPTRYTLRSSLGRGGMGEVFLADDTQLGRQVAIKFLTEALEHDPTARERLHREARSAAALDHPFICKIHEIVEIDGRTGIVMEHVSGETLQTMLQRARPSAARSLEIAGEVAEALDEAHRRRVIHRDLKPSNVMVTEQGHVKVMDFGLAKVMQGDSQTLGQAETIQPITEAGMRLGTPGYMAPEQLLGAEADARSDLFAFGILLYELLAGVHPFRRSSQSETMSAIVREPPPPIAHYAGDLPGAGSVLDRLLAKDPHRRYQTFEQLRPDLRQLIQETSGRTPLPRPAQPDAPTGETRTPYVGREPERAELRRLLDQAVTGCGGLALIGGEPGVGKTRLSEELLSEARHRGCLAITGHCYEMEGTPPFIPFVEMVERSASIVPGAAFRDALGDAAAEVARLVPELRQRFSDLPPPVELPPEQQQRYLFNNFLAFVERGARITPQVLLIDDLHWADDSTLLLLQHLAPHLAQMPMLIVGTYRDVDLEVARPFAKTLESLTRQRLATRIALRRMDQAGVGSLLEALSRQAPPPQLTQAVYRETEGNPFFVEEVFHHLSEEGQLFDEGGVWKADLSVDELAVPEGVRLVIGRRIQRLGEPSRKVLTTAAVIGRSFDLTLLEALGDVDEDAVFTALEEAEAAQLIRTVTAGRNVRWEFAHGLIRQTLENSLSFPRRQRAHLRVAQAMERVYGAKAERYAADLGHHLFHAGAAADQEKAVRFLTLAGEQAMKAGAFDEALRRFGDALSILDDAEDESPASVADLRGRRGQALRSLGRPDEAVTEWERAFEGYESLADTTQAVRTAGDLIWAFLWQARTDAAEALAHRALALLGREHDAERSRLLGLLGFLRSVVGGEYQQARAPLDEALTLAEGLNDSLALADVLINLMTHNQTYGRFIESDASARRALPLLRETERTWLLAEALRTLAQNAEYEARWGNIDELAEELLPLSEQLGHGGARWITMNTVCTAAVLRTGDLDAFNLDAQEVHECALKSPDVWAAFSHHHLAVSAYWSGRWTEAVTISATLVEVAPKGVHTDGGAEGQHTLYLAYLTGAEAAPSVEALRRWFSLADTCPTLGAWEAAAAYCEASAVLGNRVGAAECYPLLATAVDQGRLVTWAALTLVSVALGIAAGAGRRWESAEKHLEDALRLADELPHVIARPEARRWYAWMLLDRDAPGDREKARTLLAEAIELYRTIGMPKHVELSTRIRSDAG